MVYLQGAAPDRHLIFPLREAIARLASLQWLDTHSSPLNNSTSCDIARMRYQHGDVSRYSASRVELRSALGEVEKCHDGIFPPGS